MRNLPLLVAVVVCLRSIAVYLYVLFRGVCPFCSISEDSMIRGRFFPIRKHYLLTVYPYFRSIDWIVNRELLTFAQWVFVGTHGIASTQTDIM
jgi:hypothetical protein